MVDILTYRYRIGCFNQKSNLIYRRKVVDSKLEYIPHRVTILLTLIFSINLVYALNNGFCVALSDLDKYYQNVDVYNNVPTFGSNFGRIYTSLISIQHIAEGTCFSSFKTTSTNFYARMTYGNKASCIRGLKNIHLNIRSLRNKISEIKRIIHENKPHVLGLSECELKNLNGRFDESQLKIPGYDILYPKSWKAHGFARVVMYVKKTLHYQQVFDLEDELVQSVWIKGGFKNA